VSYRTRPAQARFSSRSTQHATRATISLFLHSILPRRHGSRQQRHSVGRKRTDRGTDDRRKKKQRRRAEKRPRKREERKERTRILQDSAPCRRHQRARGRLIAGLEVVADVFHLHPLDARFGADVFDEPVSFRVVRQSVSPPGRAQDACVWGVGRGREERRGIGTGPEGRRGKGEEGREKTGRDLSSMKMTCGWPATSGCTVTGKTKSSYSR